MEDDLNYFLKKEDDLNFLKMDDDLKKIMQPKTIKSKNNDCSTAPGNLSQFVLSKWYCIKSAAAQVGYMTRTNVELSRPFSNTNVTIYRISYITKIY